jgi:hypothetical protein
MELLLLILIVLLIISALPAWPYSKQWGYGPSGMVSLILIIFLVLILARYVTFT